jgi:UDP-glucose 4-epimerase
MIAAYCYMFDLTACIFRFGNVVGPRQTHGVGFDFVRRLLVDPTKLDILGDGNQSKSYVHVEDVIDAVLLAAGKAPRPFAAYNVATGDYVTVREIASLATEVLGIEAGSTKFVFAGGDRGWKGDVPVVRLNTDRIRALGWTNARSTREAISLSLEAMLVDARVGRLS